MDPSKANGDAPKARRHPLINKTEELGKLNDTQYTTNASEPARPLNGEDKTCRVHYLFAADVITLPAAAGSPAITVSGNNLFESVNMDAPTGAEALTRVMAIFHPDGFWPLVAIKEVTGPDGKKDSIILAPVLKKTANRHSGGGSEACSWRSITTPRLLIAISKQRAEYR